MSNVTRGYGLLEVFLARQRVKIANTLIPPAYRKGSILDIGCGSYPLFLMNTEFSEKYGIDGEIRVSGMRDGITLIPYDFTSKTHLPFKVDYFDVVTMLAVFEHLHPEELVSLVKEIYRIIKPGGIYILTTPAPWTKQLLRALAMLRLVSPVEIKDHKDVYSHKEIASILQTAHFRKEQIMLGYFEVLMNIWATAKK